LNFFIGLKRGIDKVELEVVVSKEHEHFVAYSSAMDLVGQGNTKDEAFCIFTIALKRKQF